MIAFFSVFWHNACWKEEHDGSKKTGALIRVLRLEKGLTQQGLAELLGVSNRAVSKWERGLGSPDLSLLPALSLRLGVDLAGLLSGGLPEPDITGGNMKHIRFFVCPQCGDLITATGKSRRLLLRAAAGTLPVQKPDEAHSLQIHPVEDEWFITAGHPMEKGHYLSFLALVTGERATVMKCWPEWDLQQRIPRRGHGALYWYCTQHGLFRQVL